MKKTIYLLLVPLLVCTAFIYKESLLTENTSSKTNLIYNSTQLQPAPQSNRFLFGAMDDYKDYTKNYSNYNNLGFNIWHTYNDEYYDNALGRLTPYGRVADDKLTDAVSTYAQKLKDTINRINSQQNNNSVVLWSRPKIEWLAYGQSSIYEAEPVGLNDPLWFYSFNNVSGTPEADEIYNNGDTVLHCSEISSGRGAGYVLSSLKANTEQCRNDDYWLGDNKGEWYIKPRIRIESSFANNIANWNTNVCKIEILNEDGNIFKSVDLKVRNFKPHPDSVYNGNYLESYYYLATDTARLNHSGAWGNKWWYKARGTDDDEIDFENHADIRVFWYDNCEMWIDYVKVENDIADELFKGIRDPWIQGEVDSIINQANPGALYKFYVEHFEFNNLPCVKYVNDRLKLYSYGKAELLTDFDDWYGAHLRWNQHASSHTSEYIYNNIISKAGFSTFFFESYPLTSNYVHNVTFESQTYSRIPVSLPKHSGDSILAWPTTPDLYNDWLQQQLDMDYSVTHNQGDNPYNDQDFIPNCPSDPNLERDAGNFRYYMRLANELQRNHNITFINMPQAHQWFRTIEVRREPTNEELDMLANLPVSYGAKGLIYFFYPSVAYFNDPYCKYYGKGMYESGELRGQNVYQETGLKREKIRKIGERMKAWEPYLLSFNNQNTFSYTYYLTGDRNEMLSSYISDIYTYKYGTAPYPCAEEYPEGDIPPAGTIGECKAQRYVQASTFEIGSGINSNYFMIVNRRCSPHYEPLEDPRYPNGEYSSDRQIKLNLNPNSTELSRYRNWKITDVGNPFATPITYYRGQTQVDLGWFEPGQGKLYKMEPVIIKGGELAGDEIISGDNFTCEAPVYNNGYNITIAANTTIHFNDSSRFVMNGGVFTVGDQNTSGSQNITSDAVTGSTWLGHSFTNCEVNIYGATFSGLTNDTTYALNFIDCPVVDIRGCTFNTNSSLKGAINTVCFSNPFLAINNVYIGGNTFNSSGSTIPTVNVSSYAGITTPLIIENNTFNEGNTAIFLNGVTGGAIKGNTITDNYIGINTLTSSIDIAENTISSSINSSTGIFSAGGSEIRLCKAGNLAIGGYNSITNTGGASNNINITGAYFLMSEGKNVFDITSNQSSNHLNGYFPYFTAVSYNEQENCFKVDNTPVDPPINYVTDGYQGSQITFTFTPYLTGCEVSQCQDYTVINLGGGVYDTICNGSSGSGGGLSGSQKRAFDLHFAKEKYDSLCVLIRYRNFTQAKSKCLDLINTYSDSIQSLNAVSKLFLASVATDTSYNAANELKTFYENLILNHGSKVSLVKRVNYFILKCKVRMHEYSQAMAGFQQIINLNPYSYEGLIARWDYMATSLLIQGQGGGISSIDNDQLAIDNQFDESYEFDNSGDDKGPFTKEQRKDIRKSINTAIEISKNDDETKMKTLEVKSQFGDVNASKELSQMKSLKQVVKTEKPKSILEHVKIVSEDIRKVFGSNTSSKGNEPKNIPSVFRLSQNYPNPFNPTTKINYDLPRDSKVNIVIYDILGREVKRLMNNELKSAGSYIIDFNASNYASGVYFYRIEAEESNGNKFVDSKKMVLLK